MSFRLYHITYLRRYIKLLTPPLLLVFERDRPSFAGFSPLRIIPSYEQSEQNASQERSRVPLNRKTAMTGQTILTVASQEASSPSCISCSAYT